MCATCGCDGVAHVHGEDGHSHAHSHAPAPRVIKLERDVLSLNNRLAQRNRRWLGERGTVGINLMSSPGAGKTTLLERTIRDLRDTLPLCVIEGDQETDRDAERIRAAGARAVQINTGTGCHLDAKMVGAALETLAPAQGGVVLIENVGNLVCPAMFDLGESQRVVIASVTEGDDKPLKYPHMFHAATLVVLNKIDLLAHVPFDADRFDANCRSVNARVQMLHLSAWRGDGLSGWYDWIAEHTRSATRAAT